jgi:hypothetical protein
MADLRKEHSKIVNEIRLIELKANLSDAEKKQKDEKKA